MAKDNVFIIGGADRGNGLIQTLTELGGINRNRLDGKSPSHVYYIDYLTKVITAAKIGSIEYMMVRMYYKQVKTKYKDLVKTKGMTERDKKVLVAISKETSQVVYNRLLRLLNTKVAKERAKEIWNELHKS